MCLANSSLIATGARCTSPVIEYPFQTNPLENQTFGERVVKTTNHFKGTNGVDTHDKLLFHLPARAKEVTLTL